MRITFKEFIERVELSESSGGERGRRRVSSRGPSSDRFERNKQRKLSSSNAALKKAGFKRSTKDMSGAKGRPTKWTETSSSSHHDTETATHANQSDYASRSVLKKGATSTRVSKLKKIRTQLGGDRTSRPVHVVAVNKKRTYNDTPSSTMTKGRSFKKEVTKGVPDNLKKAGAKTGDIVSSTPTSGSRSRMYGRTHNARTDSRTGNTINRVREAFDILSERTYTKTRSREDAAAELDKLADKHLYRLKNYQTSAMPFWRHHPRASKDAQVNKRKELIKFIDSDLDSSHTGPGLSPSQRAKIKIAAIKNAKGKGSGTMKPGNRRGEHHHLTSIEQSAKEFEGLTPEQRREKRERDAKMGKFHGNDPRNIAFVRGKNTPETRKSVISHRGLGGYHSTENKPVGHGGSVADYGSEKQIQQHRIRRIRQALRKRRLERERQQDQKARMDVAGRANNIPERG